MLCYRIFNRSLEKQQPLTDVIVVDGQVNLSVPHKQSPLQVPKDYEVCSQVFGLPSAPKLFCTLKSCVDGRENGLQELLPAEALRLLPAHEPFAGRRHGPSYC